MGIQDKNLILIIGKILKLEIYQRLYGTYKGKTRAIKGVTIFPIHGCENVHSTKKETIDKYVQINNLQSGEIKKINKLRKLVGNTLI